MKTFENRVAVITGGAGGLGKAFADKAATLNMKLVLGDIDATTLAKTADAFKARGVAVATLVGDVSKAAYADALADMAFGEFGSVHAVFNNAGVGCGGFIWENTPKDWEWVLGVNVMGVVHGVRAFVPRMLAQAKAETDYEGHIVNVSSVAGLLTPPLLGIYNVSKHAVVALSETLHHDLAMVEPRIKTSVLCPGFTPTGIGQSHRNRPGELRDAISPTASMMKAQESVAHAVSGGKLSADDVANATFEAMHDERFMIFTHAAYKPLFDARLDDLRTLGNPRNVAAMKGS